VRVAHRRAHDPVARHRPERPAVQPGGRGDLPDQPPERHHLRAEDDPGGRQLAPVVLHVGRRRHHQQRIARAQRAQALEHRAGLGGVRGSGDEGQRHGPQGLRADPTAPLRTPQRAPFGGFQTPIGRMLGYPTRLKLSGSLS
jgi:hypothetical protein